MHVLTKLCALSFLLLAAACSGTPRDSASGDGDALDAEVQSDAAVDEFETGTRSGPADAGSQADASSGHADLALPPVNAGLDYQLGGAYPPPTGVGIVSRDRSEQPAPGLYNICYVNGYQAQPDANDFWLNQHSDLVLRDAKNKPVIDPDWDEMLLDISDADKRMRLAQIEDEWIAGCARAGFDAVEIDNLDTYSRSGGRITEDDAVAFMELLSAAAHAQGLAIAQKNASEIVGRRSEMGTDFAIAEECAHYDECDVYMQAYDEHVLLIEYTQKDFDSACSKYPSYSVVERDRDLVPQGTSGYVYRGC